MSSRVVEAEPARSKPLAGVSMRISTGERHGFGASARWWTRASSFHFARAKRPADFLSPKLVRFVGSDEISPNLLSGVASSLRTRVFCLHAETSLQSLKLQSIETLIVLVLNLLTQVL